MAAKRPANIPKKTDVAIIGGGLSGLLAGVALVHHGLDVTIIERDAILGGRARSWVDETTGDEVTVGPHIFLSEYPNMRKYMRILGTEQDIVWQPGKFISMMEGTDEYVIRMYPLPPPFHYTPSTFQNMDFFKPADMWSVQRAMFFAINLREDDIMKLDNMDALTLLRKLGVKETFIKKFFAFTALAIMNVPLDECSAGSLMRFFKIMVSFPRYDVGFANRGLGHMFGPQSADIIEKAGSRVLMETTVKTVLGKDGKATGVELSDGTKIQARHVIAAVPPPAMAHVIPNDWKEHKPFCNLAQFKPCPYISTYLWFDRKITQRQFWARTFEETDINCDYYDYSNIYSNRKDQRSLITTNCIYSDRFSHMTDDDIVDAALRELCENIPAAKEAKLVHKLVVHIPMAIHCPHPGVEQLRPPVRTPVDGLLVTGDWIYTGVPASMESAAGAGWMAVEAVLQDLNRPKNLFIPVKEEKGLSGVINRYSGSLRKLPFFPDKDLYAG